MNEVCKRTGLTDRTVRFWVEQGLLTPERREQNARLYFQFTEADVQRLELVSRLRRVGFSIGQILLMQQNPALIRDTTAALCAELSIRQEEARESEAALKTALHCHTLEELADTLGGYCETRPLPEPELRFGRFDGMTEAEKRLSIREAAQGLEQRQRRKSLWSSLVAAVLLVALSVGLTLLATGYGKREPAVPGQSAEWNGWKERLLPGDSLLFPFHLQHPDFTLCGLGIDGATGLYTAVFQANEDQSRTLAFSARALPESEAELLLSVWGNDWQNGIWTLDPTAGPCDAVCYLMHHQSWYELHAIGSDADSASLLALLEGFSIVGGTNGASCWWDEEAIAEIESPSA